MMDVQFWATTDTGLARELNEDNFLVDRELSLFMVCDGMGGHAAGEVASAMSIQIVSEIIAEHEEVLEEYERNPGNSAAQQAVLDLIDRAIGEACWQVFEAAENDPERKGMGTTCCTLLLLGGRAFVGHVGDSRIYHIRDGEAEQLTMDHSFLNEMIRQGRARQGDSIPNQNAVTRAVGVRKTVEVDTFELDVKEDDLFVMCSDGLSEYLENEAQLLNLVDGDDLEASAQRCINHALEGGGRDNITTILTRVGPQGPTRRVVMGSQTLRALKECAYFAHATPSEFSQLCDIAELHRFEAGDIIIEAERPAEFLCLIINGSVGVNAQDASVTVLDTGDTFGEISLFGDHKEHEEYEALSPTRLIVFRRETLFELFRARPQLATKTLFALAVRMSTQLRRVPAELRYQPALWEEVRIHGDETPAPGFLVAKGSESNPTIGMPSVLSSKQQEGQKSASKSGPKPKSGAKPPAHPSLGTTKTLPGETKSSSPSGEQMPVPSTPPPPLPDAQSEDDIETQQSVDLEELRKTAQFDRVDANSDK